MVDVYYIENISQIRAMAEPTRWRMLGLLWEQPMTGSQLARAINIPRTRAHYQLNILKEVGLVELQHEQLTAAWWRSTTSRSRGIPHRPPGGPYPASPPANGGDDTGTGEIVRDMMLAILELAHTDILLPTRCQAWPRPASTGKTSCC